MDLGVGVLQRGYLATALLATLLTACRYSVTANAAEGYQPFAVFNPKVELDIEDGEIDMTAQFTLGSDSNGIEIATERLQLRVTGAGRSYSLTIPGGSFKAGNSGRFNYLGTIERVKIVAELRLLRPNVYELNLETEGANLNGFANPLTVDLTIGDDGGSRTVRARIE